jgi:hypothetical protein
VKSTYGWHRRLAGALNPNNSPNFKELGGTGFPACAKNTLLFWPSEFPSAIQWVGSYFKNFMNKVA